MWHQVLIHQSQEILSRLWQRVLHHVSAPGQSAAMREMRSVEQETSAPRRTDEVESEGPAALPHQEEDQHQVMRG